MSILSQRAFIPVLLIIVAALVFFYTYVLSFIGMVITVHWAADIQNLNYTTTIKRVTHTSNSSNNNKSSYHQFMVVQMTTGGEYAEKHKGMVQNIKGWCEYHNYTHIYYEINQEMIDLYLQKSFLHSFYTSGGSKRVHYLKFWFIEDIFKKYGRNVEWLVMLDVDMIVPINSFFMSFEQLLKRIEMEYKYNTSNTIFIAQDTFGTINGGFYMLHNRNNTKKHPLFVYNEIDTELQIFIDLNKAYFWKLDMAHILDDMKVVSGDAIKGSGQLDQVSVQDSILHLYSDILNVPYNHECLINIGYGNANVCYRDVLNNKFHLPFGNRTISSKYILLNPKRIKINSKDFEAYNTDYMFKHDHVSKQSEYLYSVRQAIEFVEKTQNTVIT
eukprot:266190_1